MRADDIRVAGTSNDMRRWPRPRRPDGTYLPTADGMTAVAKLKRLTTMAGMPKTGHWAHMTPEVATMAAAALDRAFTIVGSKAALCQQLGDKPPVAATWKLAPPNRVIQIARATKWQVLPHELRPDLYPYPEDAVPPVLRAEALAAFARREQAAQRYMAKRDGA